MAINKPLALAKQLAQNGQYDDAADLCRKLIKRRADIGPAKKILAHCLYEIGMLHFSGSGMLAEAAQNFREALAADAAHVNALFNLGAVLSALGEHEEAISAYQKGLRLAGDNVAVLEYLAKTQILAGRLHDASATLHKLAALVPSDQAAFLLREALLVPKIMPNLEFVAHARTTLLEKLAAMEQQPLQMQSPLRMPAPYFPFSYHGLGNREIVGRLARIYLKLVPSLAWTAPHVKTWRPPTGRVRIGIASAFFYEHSIGNTSRGLVEHLDRNKFEVMLIRLGHSKRDALADHLDQTADQVIVASDTDLDAARNAIANLKLDVLFYQDIGMEPLSYFLAFARLAPVQLTSFGHPDTTGIPNLDYFVSSENYEPPGSDADYSERLVKLPDAGTLACYHRPLKTEVAIDLAPYGITSADKIYLCPQTLFKIHPDMDDIFRGILAQDRAAKIILIEPAEKHQRNALEKRLSEATGELSDRIVFVKSQPYPSYLALLDSADVILDSLHFNGQNTSLEALSLNIPIVTMPGKFQRGRHTYGMYQAMGFTDLIATTKDEYVALAVRTANDADFRKTCQQRIAERNGVLYNNLDLVRNFEKAFIEMLSSKQTSVDRMES
jgi:protein O-GlcNAc transferase